VCLVPCRTRLQGAHVAQDFIYGVVYPIILPHLALSAPTEADRRAWRLKRARGRFAVLDASLAATGAYLCGPAITIADYLGVCFPTVGELTDFDFGGYPNVQRWIAAMPGADIEADFRPVAQPGVRFSPILADRDSGDAKHLDFPQIELETVGDDARAADEAKSLPRHLLDTRAAAISRSRA